MSNFDNFKVTTDHDDYTKLQMFLNHRLQEKAKQPLDLDSAIVSSKNLLSKDPNASNPMNLDRLRSEIHSKHNDFQKAASKVSEREESLKSELAKIAKAKNANESELLLIMTDLENKRLAETKALKEKELVSRALKDLDKKNLNALEFQKKMQMKSLKEERDLLTRKEDELFLELERLNSRLLDDEENIRKAKNEIKAGVVTIKDPDEARTQMMIEELSNIRGKEVMMAREKREELEIQRQKVENDLRAVQRGEVGRKNNSGILAGNSILTPLNLDDRRNLPHEIIRENEKWKEDLQKLNRMKQAYQDYVNNEPGYDVKPAAEFKPRFFDEMQEMVKNTNNLKPEERARMLDYIKEDIEVKDLQKSPQKPLNQPVLEPSQPARHNLAKYKLSNEPLGQQEKLQDPFNNLFSAQTFDKYKNEAQQKYLEENGIREKNQTPNPMKGNSLNRDYSSKFGQPAKNDLRQSVTNPAFPGHFDPYSQGLPGNPSYPGNAGLPYDPYNPYSAYNPYNPYNPYYPQHPPQTSRPEGNPETEKLKKELKSLKKQLESQKNPKPFSLNDDHFLKLDVGDLPEEKLLGNMLSQEQQDLKILSAIGHDPELYRAKMEHFNQMALMRTKMEASLQELTIQRMRKDLNKEDLLHKKQIEEELFREEQRKKEILLRLRPEKLNKDYSPDTGLKIGWDLVTGIPQKFLKIQIAYGVQERDQERLEPRLVAPVQTQSDPKNSLALLGWFKQELHDLKQLPPLISITCMLEVQGIDTSSRVAIAGWTAFELFTHEKKVAEGYWKLPIYLPPRPAGVYMGDINKFNNLPNSFLYIRVFSADNAPKFPATQDLARFQVPIVHLKDGNYINETKQSARSLHPDHVFPPGSIIPSRISSNAGNRQGYKLPSAAPSHAVSRQSARGDKQGVVINLETLNNFKSRSFLQFKLTIFRNSEKVIDDRGGFCLWTSDPVNTQNADVSVLNSVGHSRASNNFNPEVHINRSTHFLKDFRRLLQENNWSDDLILTIEILERNPRRISVVQGGLTSPVDDYFPVAWTLYVMSDLDQRRLLYGTIELDLFKNQMPADLSLIESAERVGGTIKFTIQDMTPNVAGQLRQAKTPSKSEPFLENNQPQWDDGRLFQKGDGIDVYVDQARFLPDNTTCCKIFVKTYNKNLESLGSTVAGLAELESPAFSPVFGFRTELRTPVFDPTLILVISVLTIDAAHKTVRLVGYSAINLFLNKYRKTSPKESNEEDIILNSGCFQLPIHCQEPYRTLPFTLENFTSLEMVPCATLLVRIRYAPKAKQGVEVLGLENVPKNEWYIRNVIVPAPKYETRAYNTTFCMPNHAEREIYAERANREGPTVAQATYNMMKALGANLDIDEDQANDWIDKTLQLDPNTGFIDLKYLAVYSKKLGFKVSIDAFHHVTGLMPLVALVSVNPPASLYSQTVISQDIHVVDKYDWNSAVDTPAFLDGFQTFKNVEFNEFLNVIIDVRQVDLAGRSLKPLAWTIIPVFFNDGYVKSGIFQIPLFAGRVPSGLLDDLISQDPWEFLLKASEKSGGPKFFQNSSVLCRLVDAQREGHFNKPLDLNRMDYFYIPKKLLERFSYNSASFQKNASDGTLKSLIKGGISPANYTKELHDIVKTELNLPYI